MTRTLEQTVKHDSLNTHLIPSKKFKTITLELKFRETLDRNTITKRALLPFVLKKGSKNYPEDSKIQEKLDDLYGASLNIGGQKMGDHHVMTVHMEIANDKFIGEESSLVSEALSFLKEVAFNPNVNEGSFDKTIVQQVKDTLRKHYQSIKDEKMTYANIRLVDEMAEGETYQIHSHGYEEDLEGIDGSNLYAYFKDMIERDVVDLYVIGDFNVEEMEAAISEHVDGFRLTQPASPHHESKKLQVNDSPKEVIEEDDLQQAKLHIGYRTQTVFKDKDFPGMLVYSVMLGGHPGSKLFLNVREENSLAYYVAAQLDFFTDKLFVFSGIAPTDYEKAHDIIDVQVAAMQNGDFTQAELDEAKSMIASQLRSALDQAGGMIDLEYQAAVGDSDRSAEQLIAEIEQITKEDIVRNAAKVQKDTIYLLTSKEGNSNA
ncbi:putative inactive metalloprotease YmfF [Lentibacillus sp. JNUCC-1]|uniref:EF-P 5-aminopentanol modification-associated protein YfmF n=1 Tax=Lentibacillus sp. JNUCC-1 TaxID=2654513 RepID=UPI00132C0269|nr:pitrilysin family protein [Lentibacillus sp. JNUCC-1]MUV38210.1 putative inactive metalloprotease YmfF [Lentibacillus sp. JNUCC-1]